MKQIFFSLSVIFCLHTLKAQIVCLPLPTPGSELKVNVNNYLAFTLNCKTTSQSDANDTLVAEESNQLANWSINGQKVQPSQQTPYGTIYFSAERLPLYRAPARKPVDNIVTLKAEFINKQKATYTWTIHIVDEAATEVYFEDAASIMKVKTDLKSGPDLENQLAQFKGKLTPEAEEKIKMAKSKGVLEANKYPSNARAQFVADGDGKHFIISVADPDNPKSGLAFELPDTLMTTYETNSTDCKAGITFGITNCKIQVQTKGYVNETTDEHGELRQGSLLITLTEVGKPGEYVKGTFMGRLVTHSRNCGGTPETGGHVHPIEIREVYGSFVVVRQINIIR
jgi:hypothetical protein